MQAPIKDFNLSKYPKGSITQWFGENRSLYRMWGLEGHNGIDIVAPHGTPMYAVEDARVVSVKLDPSGYGKHVRIRSTRLYDGAYRCWTYGHCSRIRVLEGEIVKEGDYIADMGNTGFVVSGPNPYWDINPYAGTHLHLGLRYLTPDKDGWKYAGDNIRYTVEDYDNGLKGAVNPFALLAGSDDDTKKAKMLTIISLLNTVLRLLRIKNKQ